MRKTKLRSRVVAMMLSLLTVLSVVPSVSMTASAATEIPKITESTPLKDNPYMQALFAVGFDKNGWGKEKSNNGTYKMFDYSLWDSFESNVWTNSKGIKYNLNSSANGLDPKVTSSTTPENLITEFNNKGGLCCASFVSYVIFNYLPNKGYDISRYGKASEISNLSYVDSWDTYYRNKSGCEVTDVPEITGVSNNEQLKTKIQQINLRDDYGAKIGDIMIFGTKNDKTEHIAIYAGRYKSSSGKYYDWVIDLGNSAGPRLTPTVAMYKNSTIMQPTATIPFEQFGGISVKKVDKDTGEALEGAIFEVKDSNGNWVADLGPTDVNGYAETKKELKPGTYTVTEIQAPPNYELSSQSQTVTVVADTITPCHHIAVNTHRLIVCREHVRK